MKRILTAALAAALLLAAAGCGSPAESAAPSLTVDGTEITGDTPVDDVLALLGEDYAYYEAISCVYDGMDKTYTYPDAIVYTYPDGEQDCLMELYCTGGDVSAGGISFGASRDQVIDAFGEDYTEEGSMLVYAREPSSANLEPASLYFELTDGSVTAIAITAEHRSQ